MGLLGEIYSAGDSAKRKLKGLLSDPLGELGLLGARAAEDMQTFLDTGAKAYPMLDPRLKPRLDTPQGREMVVDQNAARRQFGDMAGNMGMAATFIGPGAKTWNKAMAERAEELEKAKTDPRIIWKETGTFKGPDGKWRQEIDDSAAKLNFDALPEGKSVYQIADEKLGQMPAYQGIKDGLRIGNPKITPDDQSWALRWAEQNPQEPPLVPLNAAFSHGPLNDAYGDLGGLKIGRLFGRANGVFDDATNSIRTGGGLIGKSSSAEKSTTLHELQHAIQQREGWARGGSPVFGSNDLEKAASTAKAKLRDVNARSGLYEAAEKRASKTGESIGDLVINPEWFYKSRPQKERVIFDEYKKAKSLAEKSAQDQYLRLAGEAEARATQSRMNMDAAKRREVFPLDSYDVPLNELIVRGGLLGVAP